jgi:hypothetical protein
MSKTTAGPVTFISVGTTDTAILPANLGRREVTIVNDGANVVYLSFGTGAAVANAGVRLNAAGGSYTTNNWEGAIRGIAVTAASVLTVAEF